MAMLKFIFDSRGSGLKPLSFEEYGRDLLANTDKAKLAFEKAWATRNFEIELYWKRASYFWAFIASTLVGYFALTNSDAYRKPDRLNHVEAYFVICIGLVLATAWLLINIGSKAWQRHWEVHVDLLEDQVIGPLYKTVHPEKTFSVSKINEIVSFSFVVVWCLLGTKYFIDNELVNFTSYRVNWLVVLSTIGTALAIVSILFGHGRGRFSYRPAQMHRRSTSYKLPPEDA